MTVEQIKAYITERISYIRRTRGKETGVEIELKRLLNQINTIA